MTTMNGMHTLEGDEQSDSKEDIKETTKPRINGAKPLSKTLSKSHDNLASTLRKKAVAASLAENKSRVASPGPGKFKVPKVPDNLGPQIRKAHSQQNIGKPEEPIKRAQSAQNISSTGTAVPESAGKKLKNAPTRTVSTQNISHKHKNRHAKLSSTNSSNAMAYNAELLAMFEKEKRVWERKLSELNKIAETRKTDGEKLKIEIKSLKAKIPSQNVCDELELLRSENKTLKSKLHELGVIVEHSTDSEKLSLLQKEQKERENREFSLGGFTDRTDVSEHGNSLDLLDGDNLSDHHYALSLENNWDKGSNKSDPLSEVSVACLQDRILQMEETHYSTSEELQATLQELGDLQDSVNELTDENERLADEKSVLLESLCAQTEKLENCRMQIEQLKAILVNDIERTDRSENERQLAALVKGSQVEKEEFQLRLVELSNCVSNQEAQERENQDVIQALRDKSNIMEMKNESLMADKRALEAQMTEMKESMVKEQIELQRYRTLLENEKQKVLELEQFRQATHKSQLETLLDKTRVEKEKLEEKLTNIQEQLAVSESHVVKLEENNSSLEEQIKVLKNNAKSEVAEMNYKLERKEKERVELQEEMGTLRDHIDQLQMDCDRYLEEKKTYTATIGKLEGELNVYKQKSCDIEIEAREIKSKYSEDQEEWKQFQADLQTAVVIANDFKVAAQNDIEKISAENQYLRDLNASLQEELDKAKAESVRLQQEKEQVSGIRGKVISSVDRELASLRTAVRKPTDLRNPSISVKNIISSIEEQVKVGSSSTVTSPLSPNAPSPLSPSLLSSNGSRRNSTDSNLSFSSIKSEGSPRTVTDRVVVRNKAENKEGRSPITHRHTIQGISSIIYEALPVSDEKAVTSPSSSKVSDTPDGKKTLTSILRETPKSSLRRGSTGPEKEQTPEKALFAGPSHSKSDPLGHLAKEMGGSKRNALLTWCKLKTASYSGIDITNFSSSWNDGLAFCALLHSYLPSSIPYKDLNSHDQQQNFTLAFKAAESVGIQSNLTVSDMVAMERPDWQAVMNYVTSIYKHFEVDSKA